MNLLIDCGNSSVKLAFSNGSIVEEVYSIDHSSDSSFKSNLKLKVNQLKKHFSIKEIFIVSVNKEIEPILKEALIKVFNKVPIKFLKNRKFKSFKTSYKNPAMFGLDRFFNCIGGNLIYPKSNLIIVDMGTATTFDVIDKKLSHIGGIIIPGALTAHYSLLSNTSMIKTREIILTNKLLGSSTSECLSSGFVNGQVHMIRGIVQEIQQTSKLKFKVLITGGISNIFLESFKDYEYHSSLVLNGIVNYINKSN